MPEGGDHHDSDNDQQNNAESRRVENTSLPEQKKVSPDALEQKRLKAIEELLYKHDRALYGDPENQHDGLVDKVNRPWYKKTMPYIASGLTFILATILATQVAKWLG